MEDAEYHFGLVTFVSSLHYDLSTVAEGMASRNYRAILTILQIESAANDPLTRYSALLSMVCALMSLIYGCVYIIRFGTMRKTYKAAEWTEVSVSVSSHCAHSFNHPSRKHDQELEFFGTFGYFSRCQQRG